MNVSPTTVHPPPRHPGGFTIVELIIAVAVVALLATIAIPAYQRMIRRSQATIVKEDLRLLDNALGMYALDANKRGGATVSFAQLKPYLKPNTPLYETGADLFGNLFGPQFTVNVCPKPPVPTYEALSDVTDAAFWSPFGTP